MQLPSGGTTPVLYSAGVDILDGTPILDIKPYIPYADRIETASDGWIHDEVPKYDVRFEEDVIVPADFRGLLVDTMCIDPRPVPQKKRWPVRDSASETQAFSFRLADWDVHWVIRNGAFWVTRLEHVGPQARKQTTSFP